MLKRVNQKGFTIIEVLIVLAIAGVIMLVVFLAVPALQRNSRNTQRTSDASLITAAINECFGNNNGSLTACNTTAATGKLSSYLDTGKLRQLTTVYGVPTAGTASTDAALVVFGTKCDATGAASTTTGAGGKSFTVVYSVETNGAVAGRCIES
jgi:prepilin-type N-terminal cleavage/methylation domain-containing protein